MDVRLVAYRDVIVPSGVIAAGGIGSYNQSINLCYFIDPTSLPTGVAMCDAFRVGTKIYNVQSEFVGTVNCCSRS